MLGKGPNATDGNYQKEVVKWKGSLTPASASDSIAGAPICRDVERNPQN